MVMDPPYDKASRVEMIWQSDLRQRYAMRSNGGTGVRSN